MIAEQLWYICEIYPESISEEDAKKAFKNEYKDKDYEEKQADFSYWDVALKIVNLMLTSIEASIEGGQMFYVVNAEDGRILDSSNECPDPKAEAMFFKCPVYIIEGAHSGLSADGPKGGKS